MAQDSQTYETIAVETRDGITTVMLNRPSKKNAMNPRMHMEMSELLERLEHDDETRVLVITGAGDTFCAGMDIKEVFYDLDKDPHMRQKVRELAQWRSHRLRLFPKPTIAAINGWCFGGAFTIVACSDIAIASEDAVFGLSEVNFGKIAGGLVSKAILDVMNIRDAIYYVLTGETFTGREAADMKLVTKAVPAADLQSTVDAVAQTLAEKNPAVVRASKEALKQVAGMNYEQATAWLRAQSRALDHETSSGWRKGVEQFASKSFKPGLENYEWQK